MKYTHFFCIRLHFTTKRQSQIIAFVSIVYVFFASSSVLPFLLQWIHSKEFTCFDSLSVCFCYYSGYDVAYCGICECVCSFRLGFLIYLHVARCVARVVHTIRILYSSKAELAGYTTLEPIARNENCIKRIDNEFTRQILLRVLATVNVWRVEAATKWNIEQFHKVNGMSLIHTISLFTANIFINHQYSFTCSIKFKNYDYMELFTLFRVKCYFVSATRRSSLSSSYALGIERTDTRIMHTISSWENIDYARQPNYLQFTQSNQVKWERPLLLLCGWKSAWNVTTIIIGLCHR